LVWRLLGGPSCYVCGSWLVLSQFGSSSGPVDPRECVWFVEKVSPRIDDMSFSWAMSPSLVWLPSGPFWPLGLLVLDQGFVPWIICLLDGVLAQFHLHTFSDQHLLNSSNNHPILTFTPSDAQLLHDSWRSKWVISDRQHDPPHLVLCSSLSKGKN